jgi:hypothetical protein
VTYDNWKTTEPDPGDYEPFNLTRAPVTIAQRDVDQLSEEKPRLGTGAQ